MSKVDALTIELQALNLKMAVKVQEQNYLAVDDLVAKSLKLVDLIKKQWYHDG